MAASLKNRTFTNLADLNDGVLGDDYVHGALETWKLKAKTTNGGKVDYKAKIKHTQKDGQLSGNYSDEGKFQFPYQKYTFWLGFRRSGDLKVHADFGNVQVGGKDVNVFSNLKTDVNFKNFNFRVGTNYFGDNLTSSTRLETVTNATQHTDLGLTNRTFFKQGNLFYALVTSFGLCDGIALRKYDAIVGYEKDNLNVYVKHESAKSAGLGLGKLTATVTASQDKNNFGAEVTKDFGSNAISATAGVQGQLSQLDATVKGKINNDLDLELALKKTVNKQLTVTASGKLALSKGAKAVDFTKYVPIPFGVQFEVNI